MAKAFFKGIDLYDNVNPRILEFYSGEKRILDIGCGSGLYGKTIKSANPGAVVYGIDYSNSAGVEATKVLDRYDEVDLDRGSMPEYGHMFDLIVIADVLEHLKRPDQLLSGLHSKLTDDGHVLISVPNIAHFRIRKALLKGKFEYTDTGILDRTHLKFFTYATLRRMIDDCGFTVVGEKYISELPGLLGYSPRKGSPLHTYITEKFPTLMAVQFILKLQPKR